MAFGAGRLAFDGEVTAYGTEVGTVRWEGTGTATGLPGSLVPLLGCQFWASSQVNEDANTHATANEPTLGFTHNFMRSSNSSSEP